ncbi:hypothetical protein SMICM304S_05516 [Streptomyces microflavus]
MRGYDWWSDAMAGFLHFHGIPGFLANTEKVNDGDTERQEWANFLAAWHAKFGSTPQGIGQVMKSYLGAGIPDGWDDTFILIERKSGRELSAMSAGIKLKERVDRPIGGLVLRVHKPGGPNSKKSNQYFVEPHRAGGGFNPPGWGILPVDIPTLLTGLHPLSRGCFTRSNYLITTRGE